MELFAATCFGRKGLVHSLESTLRCPPNADRPRLVTAGEAHANHSPSSDTLISYACCPPFGGQSSEPSSNRHPGQVHLASSSPRVKLAPHVRPNLHDQSRTWNTPLKECTSHDPECLPRYRQAQMIAHLRLESSLQLLVRSAAFDRTGSPRASAVDHVSGYPGGSWLARLDTTRLATTRAIHARYVRPDSAIDHFIMCTRASPALGEGLLRARGTFDPETPNLRGCPRGPDQGHRWFMPPISLRRIVPLKPCEYCPLASGERPYR